MCPDNLFCLDLRTAWRKRRDRRLEAAVPGRDGTPASHGPSGLSVGSVGPGRAGGPQVDPPAETMGSLRQGLVIGLIDTVGQAAASPGSGA